MDNADEGRRWTAGRPVVLKSLDASAGPGVGVTLWTNPSHDEPPPVPGPYLVQEWIASDRVDRKLYVIGARSAGLLKQRATGTRPSELFEPCTALVEVVRAVGEVLGLVVYGVDLVEGTHGPEVVDVNAFPSTCRPPAPPLLTAATAPQHVAPESGGSGEQRWCA